MSTSRTCKNKLAKWGVTCNGTPRHSGRVPWSDRENCHDLRSTVLNVLIWRCWSSDRQAVQARLCTDQAYHAVLLGKTFHSTHGLSPPRGANP